MSISELAAWEKGHVRTHFWSLDKNGQSEMSEAECRRWGLPKLALSVGFAEAYLWPTHVYPTLRQWQVARGFDPSTTDFARNLGYPEFESIDDKRTTGGQVERAHARTMVRKQID
ncbi:hypothetical protein VNI00_003512 [Paramarasmius palmivorus]|uniref:Uncharacterized protein n=1 Tax=Paramarasmius palmivorus TaxID=297713 RepID=A0AAW0DPE3_9AGAR